MVFIKGHISPFKGKKRKPFSEEHKRKISKNRKGCIAWNKGLKGVIHSSEMREKISSKLMGIKRSESTRNKMSLSKRSFRNYNFGKQLSIETRKKIGLGNKGKKLTEETKAKIREARAKQKLPFKDTKPERILQNALRAEGIKFETHKAILGQPDIFIEPNICIFVDGDYWHSLPYKQQRDIFVTENLEKENYIVIRLWEHEIYEELRNCILQILSYRRV